MFDDFTHHVRAAAQMCNFKCTSTTCTVQETLIRDQIIIGTSNQTIREEALKKQWTLNELTTEGRKMESGSIAISEIKTEPDADVNRTKGGAYSRKHKQGEHKGKRFLCWKCEKET